MTEINDLMAALEAARAERDEAKANFESEFQQATDWLNKHNELRAIILAANNAVGFEGGDPQSLVTDINRIKAERDAARAALADLSTRARISDAGEGVLRLVWHASSALIQPSTARELAKAKERGA